MNQAKVANEYLYTGKLQLPVRTDIRINDKIIESSTGLEYYAQVPRTVRNHYYCYGAEERSDPGTYIGRSFNEA